jgi:hypothetical protein
MPAATKATAIAFIKTKLRSDATFGFRDSYFFPKTPKYHSGENLYTLTPPRLDGVLKNLTQLANGEVQGPEVSFDGVRILFAMRRDKTRDGFHIFEVNSDGSGLRQLQEAIAMTRTVLPAGWRILLLRPRGLAGILSPGTIPRALRDERGRQWHRTDHLQSEPGL